MIVDELWLVYVRMRMMLLEKSMEFVVVVQFLVLLVMLNFVLLKLQMIQLIYQHYFHELLVEHFPMIKIEIMHNHIQEIQN